MEDSRGWYRATYKGVSMKQKKVCTQCHGASKDCPICKGQGRDYTKKELNKVDMVNYPPHYMFGMIEPIEVIEDWELDFCLGNVIKYIARAGRKVTVINDEEMIQDLKKAQWYLNRRIKQMEDVSKKE